MPVAALSPEKAKKQSTKKTSDAPKKRKLAAKEKTAEKKFKASPRYEKEAIGTTVAKGVSKVSDRCADWNCQLFFSYNSHRLPWFHCRLRSSHTEKSMLV